MECRSLILQAGGPDWVFIFCGYGQKAETFRTWPASDVMNRSWVAFELPDQAVTTPLTRESLKQFFIHWMQDQTVRSITGLSFSMGSRINLILPHCFPLLVKRLVFLAPDAIGTSFWFRVATTKPGSYVFRFLCRHEHAFSHWCRILNRLHLIPRERLAQLTWYMRHGDARRRVYHTWMNMRALHPRLTSLRPLLHAGLQAEAWFGTQDAVIPIHHADVFKRILPEANMYWLGCGHDLFHHENRQPILDSLNRNITP